MPYGTVPCYFFVTSELPTSAFVQVLERAPDETETSAETGCWWRVAMTTAQYEYKYEYGSVYPLPCILLWILYGINMLDFSFIVSLYVSDLPNVTISTVL